MSYNKNMRVYSPDRDELRWWHHLAFWGGVTALSALIWIALYYGVTR